MLNLVCSRYCRNLNHPEDANTPAMIDKIMAIDNLILKETIFFLLDFDDIQRLIAANARKIKAEAKNNLILEKKVIKKICEKPKALNHKKSVYNPIMVDIEKRNMIIIPIITLMNMFFFMIGLGYWLLFI